MSIPEFNRDASKINKQYNRGYDTKHPPSVVEPVKVGLETIDNAIISYLQKKIVPVVTQDGKQIKVPVIYGNPERWKSVQQDGAIRDKNGKIILPIIMVRRTEMQKNRISSPVNKYQRYLFKMGWNSRNIYDKFGTLNGYSPSQMYHSVVVPDHYDITYQVIVWTEYMEQMNRVIENISFEDDEYWGEDNNYKFISRITRYQQTTDLPANNDRLVRNSFEVGVHAYILPESALDKNGNKQLSTQILFSPKRVVFDTEIVTDLKNL